MKMNPIPFLLRRRESHDAFPVISYKKVEGYLFLEGGKRL